nr:MAG TPA: hypothetical protein [Caudoviricetes sp.]
MTIYTRKYLSLLLHRRQHEEGDNTNASIL